MFPNPQDALPLPPRPDLDQYKKQAKDLVKACRSGDPDAIGQWAADWIETLAELQDAARAPDAPEAATTPGRRQALDRAIDQVETFARKKLSNEADGGEAACRLTDAQFVIARSHGFESWPKLAAHIEALARANAPVSRFESAADAVVTGDLTTLDALLRDEPRLVHARSTREHRAPLLIYVSANGVEGYRQKSPQNAVAIAKMLLDAGAEVDATADVYGGGWTTLGLVATSSPPRDAGVQIGLLDLLLARGARMDAGPRGRTLVISCLGNGCPGAAEFLVSRGAPIDLEAAAALGRVDLVRTYFTDDGHLNETAADASNVMGGTHASTATATRAQVQSGLRWACILGRIDVVDFLTQKDKGIDLARHDADGQTPLHCAAIGGHLDIIRLLLSRNAPLEIHNVYGGTVLGQTLWSAAHRGTPDTYIPIIETLIAAGAKVPERHPPINPRVDAVLERHGSHADPTRWWYGEEPRKRRRRRQNS